MIFRISAGFRQGHLELPDGRIVPARLLFDTGATACLALNTPTVDHYRLAEPESVVLPITSGALFVGGAKSCMGRLPGDLAGIAAASRARVRAREAEGDRADSTNDGYLGASFSSGSHYGSTTRIAGLSSRTDARP